MDEKELRSSVNKAYWVVAKDRVDYQEQTDMKKELTEAFNRIKEQVGRRNDGKMANSRRNLKNLTCKTTLNPNFNPYRLA